jgi:hypothetical protein
VQNMNLHAAARRERRPAPSRPGPVREE